VMDNAFSDPLKGSKAATQQQVTTLARLLVVACQNYLNGTAAPLNAGGDHDKSAAIAGKTKQAIGFSGTDQEWPAVASQILKTASLFIGATAGARQLGANEPSSNKAGVGSLDGDYFWGKLKSEINRARKAADVNAGSAFTMEGRFEAVLGYTAASVSPVQSQSYLARNGMAFIEMGGASVQICVPNGPAKTAFVETEGIVEVAKDKLPDQLSAAVGNVPAVSFMCHSFLGNAINRMFAQVIANQWLADERVVPNRAGALKNPCLPAGYSIVAQPGKPFEAKWGADPAGSSDVKALRSDLYTVGLWGNRAGQKFMQWLQKAGNKVEGSGTDAFGTGKTPCGQCAALINQVYSGKDEVGSSSSSYADQLKLVKQAVDKWLKGVNLDGPKKPALFFNIKSVFFGCNGRALNYAPQPMGNAVQCLKDMAGYAGKGPNGDGFFFNQRTTALNIKHILDATGLSNPKLNAVYGDAGWEDGLVLWLKKGLTVKQVMKWVSERHWIKDATKAERNKLELKFRGQRKFVTKIHHILDHDD